MCVNLETLACIKGHKHEHLWPWALDQRGCKNVLASMNGSRATD